MPEGLGKFEKALASAQSGNNFVKLGVQFYECTGLTLFSLCFRDTNVLLEFLNQFLPGLFYCPPCSEPLDKSSDFAYLGNLLIADGMKLTRYAVFSM